MLTRRIGVVLVVVPLLFAGCNRGKDEPAEPPNEEPMLELRMKVSGDIDGNVETTVKGRLMKHRDKASDEATHFLTVQPMDPFTIGTAAMRPSVAILRYRGDGRYRLQSKKDTASGSDANAGPNSSVELAYWETGKTTEFYPEIFLERLEDCVVDVDDDGNSGSANCPKLQTQRADKTISLEFRWKVADA